MDQYDKLKGKINILENELSQVSDELFELKELLVSMKIIPDTDCVSHIKYVSQDDSDNIATYDASKL